MNGTSFVGLIQNVALLLAVTCIFDVVVNRLRTERASFVQVIFGLTLGTIGIIVMLTPWTFGQGIVFDTRSILLGIAGLYFGAIPTLIAMAMTAVFRFYQGGAGVLTGIIVVITSGTIGIAWRYFHRRSLAEISWRDLYLFGIMIHLVMLAMMFTLPWETALRVLANIALPVMVIYPVGTVLLGVLMTARLRRELVAEALTRSEDKFRKAFYTSPDAININRLEDGMYVSINPGFTSTLGYTEQHIIGKTSIEYNIWDNIEDRQRLVDGLKRDGTVTNLEAAFRTKNGDTIQGLMSATLIDLDGVPHILSITRDITDRKQAEEALRESERQYRELIDGMTETVWVIDFNGDLIDVNKSTLEVLGYSKEELLSIGLYGIDSSLKKDDIQALAKAMPSDKVQIFETSHKTKDGKIFPVEVYSSLVTYQGKPAILSIARDITDRKQAEEALRESEEKFRTIFDRAGDGILIADAETKKLIQGNAAICSMLGYTEEEITGLTITDIHPPKDMPRILDEFEEQTRGEKTLAEGLPVMRKDGSIFYADITAAPTTIGGTDCLLGIFHDITERKLMEETVARAAREWQSTFDAANDAIWIMDSEHRVLQSNRTAERLFHLSRSEIIGKYCWEIVHGTTQPIPECPIIRAEKSLSRETMELRIGENWFEVTADPILNDAGRFSGAVHIISDITERKQAEDALRESENQYRLLADNARDVIFILDMNLDYIYVSPSVKILRGYESEEVFQQPASQTVTASSWDLAMLTFSEVMELEKSEQRELVVSRTLELEMVRKDGTTVWTEVQFTLLRDENQLPAGILGVTRNIDDRKRGEEELQRSEDFLNKIIEESPSPMWISDEKGLLIRINPACCHLLNITAEEVMGKYNILNDNIVEEQGFLPLVKSVFEKGETVRFDLKYQTSRLNQLKIQGETSLILDVTIFPIRGSDGKVVNAVIQHIDITDRKRAEERLQETLGRLRKTVETNIQVMVSAVEARDPYTAGHQIQVADLARAIATEMGLPQEKIDGISMAGSIHDIGKLSIPSEILSKPTRLLDIEFSLIKEHSLKGYEILEGVETDWPLAEIVYQHHERMDGSGYPRRLKGEEILIEARIIAVADVVESMASHRPYRPALGIDAALAEISKNRDTLYDPEVTDACLRLFQENGYRFN